MAFEWRGNIGRYRGSYAAMFSKWTVTDVPQAEADELMVLYNDGDGPNWTNNSGWGTDPVVDNWYGVTVSGGNVTQVSIANNNGSGDVSDFDPSTLSSLTYLRLNANSFSGDLSSWSLPSSLAYLHLNTNSFSGAPGWVAGNLGMRNYQFQDNSLSEAVVDAVCQSIYDNRADFTYATPSLNVGGTNSAPSGTYQDGDPPSTGKEYIYEVVNDPESEGFNTWSVTYNS